MWTWKVPERAKGPECSDGEEAHVGRPSRRLAVKLMGPSSLAVVLTPALTHRLTSLATGPLSAILS